MKDLQQYVTDEMLMRPVLRMDIFPISSGTNVEAEVLNYWSDDEGACVVHIKYRRDNRASTIQVGVVTQAFMMDRRHREIATHLQPIMAAWLERGWHIQYHLLVRVARPMRNGHGVWMEKVNPLNMQVVQDLVRLETAVELTQAKPLDVATALCYLPRAEHLLESELKCTLGDTVRKLEHVIQDANKQLASITQL